MEAKILQRCLDGASRSKMNMLLFSMLAAGMLKEEGLVDFSDELRTRISHFLSSRD